MAYKDEYEVARLYSDGEFAKALKEQFDGDPSVKVSLAPPLLARRDKVTGHLRKREFGSWIFRAFELLTRFKFLRGTAFDPFGYTAERRMERALAGRVFRDDLPPSRQGEAAGLAAAGGAGEIRGTRSRLRPHQGSQCREIPRGMRAAGEPRSASRWRRRPNRAAHPGCELFHSRDHSSANLVAGNGWNCPAGFLHDGCSSDFWLISGGL